MGVYKLESDTSSNDFGTWRVPRLELVGDATDEQMVKVRQFMSLFDSGNVRVAHPEANGDADGRSAVERVADKARGQQHEPVAEDDIPFESGLPACN